MNLDFITPSFASGAPPPESPMAAAFATAGATLELRDGWLVPAPLARGAASGAARQTVAFADVSSLPKTELQGPPHALRRAGELTLGTAELRAGAWWCPLTQTKTLVIGEPPAAGDVDGIDTIDVTAQLCALRIEGPLTRQLMSRFCSLDLRPDVAVPGSLLPGSVARTPGLVIVEASQRLLVLAGAALAEYLWTVVAVAARRLGGGPATSDELGGVSVTVAEAAGSA